MKKKFKVDIAKRVKCKIKQGDKVILIAGKDKGKSGKVTRVIHLDNGSVKVVVEGLNLVKKHVKPNPNRDEQGGIKSREFPLDISNVMILNEQTGKGERIGFKVLEDGRKVRCFKSTGDIIGK